MSTHEPVLLPRVHRWRHVLPRDDLFLPGKADLLHKICVARGQHDDLQDAGKLKQQRPKPRRGQSSAKSTATPRLSFPA